MFIPCYKLIIIILGKHLTLIKNKNAWNRKDHLIKLILESIRLYKQINLEMIR